MRAMIPRFRSAVSKNLSTLEKFEPFKRQRKLGMEEFLYEFLMSNLRS